MTYILEDGFRVLVDNGLVEFLIFLLIFAVIFGVLMQVKLFGDNESQTKKYNALIALSMALIFVLPHHFAPGTSIDLVDIISDAIPQTMLVLVAILGTLILLGMFGWTPGNLSGSSWFKPVVGIILFGIVIWIFVGSANMTLPYWMTYDLVSVIVALIVFGGLVAWIMSGGDSDDDSSKSGDDK